MSCDADTCTRRDAEQRWLRPIWGRVAEMPTPTEPVRIAEGLSDYAGLWVAVKGDRVVEVGRTPDEVMERLHQREIRDAAVLRMPSEHDRELVGLG